MACEELVGHIRKALLVAYSRYSESLSQYLSLSPCEILQAQFQNKTEQR
jgi:hypothetical protein